MLATLMEAWHLTDHRGAAHTTWMISFGNEAGLHNQQKKSILNYFLGNWALNSSLYWTTEYSEGYDGELHHSHAVGDVPDLSRFLIQTPACHTRPGYRQ